jgi:hypothetical protein
MTPSKFACLQKTRARRAYKVGIPTGYGLDRQGSIPVRCKRDLSSPQRSDRRKADGAWCWPHTHLMPRSRMVEDASISPYVFIVWCLIKHRDNFTFYSSVPITWVGAISKISLKRLHHKFVYKLTSKLFSGCTNLLQAPHTHWKEFWRRSWLRSWKLMTGNS